MFSHYLTELFSLTNGETQQEPKKQQDLLLEERLCWALLEGRTWRISAMWHLVWKQKDIFWGKKFKSSWQLLFFFFPVCISQRRECWNTDGVTWHYIHRITSTSNELSLGLRVTTQQTDTEGINSMTVFHTDKLVLKWFHCARLSTHLISSM